MKKNHKNPSTRILLLSHVKSPRSVGPLAGCLATCAEVQKFRSEKAQKEAEVGKVREEHHVFKGGKLENPGVPTKPDVRIFQNDLFIGRWGKKQILGVDVGSWGILTKRSWK